MDYKLNVVKGLVVLTASFFWRCFFDNFPLSKPVMVSMSPIITVGLHVFAPRRLIQNLLSNTWAEAFQGLLKLPIALRLIAS